MDMEQICRICLKTVQDSKYEIIEEIRKEMFEVLLLKLNFDVGEGTIICSSCIKQLDDTFQFKAMCLYTEDCIYPFVDQENDTKLDMREVYYKSDKQTVIKIESDEDVCRLCMEVFHNNFFCTLGKTEKDMIDKYIPEINMFATLRTLFCKTCIESLVHNFGFLMKCLQTEDRIKSYRDNRSICDNSEIKLSQVIQFARKNENGMGDIKLEDFQWEKDDMPEDKAEYSANDDNNLPTCSKKVPGSNKNEHHSKPLVTSQNGSYCKICQRQFKSQLILQKHFKNIHENPSEIYRCEKCSFQTRYKVSMKEHKMMHMDPSERKLFPCELCPYKAKRPSQLKKHLSTHKEYEERPKFKCPECPYEVIHNDSFKRHMLTHKDDSEVRWYKCEKCPYKSKIQSHLNRHLIVHKNISEIKHFSCTFCPYKTKRKTTLRTHEIKHKKLREITTFDCYQCPYKAKYKGNLRTHITTCHQKEPQLYSCDKCSMTTKYASYLKTHSLTHMDKSETPMYGCDQCTYETKIKHRLTEHKKVHADLKLFKCEFCSTKLKSIGSLKRHQLFHKNANETPIYKCRLCSYQSKRKDSFGCHLKTHKG